MSRRARGIGARIGLPVHAQRHPDPAVRRAYWAEVKRAERIRKHAAEQRNFDRCRRNFGPARCNEPLEFRTDRLGRIVPTCRKCERRERGICATCPRRVAGKVGRALYCATCRPREKYRQKIERETADRERTLKAKRDWMRQRRRQWRRDLASPDPEVRARAEAALEIRRAQNRVRQGRHRDRSRAGLIPKARAA